MKALYRREATGEGSCINMSMFESSVSWLTVPITLSTLLKKKITRRGNTHEFFSPVSVYKTSNGFVYVAMGNDRQWKSLISHEIFKPLDKPEYEKNAGRIRDVENLNKAINEITRNHTSEELIELFKSMTLPISKIKTIPEVVADPLVERRLLFAEDQKTGTRITLPPPPNMTPFLEESNRKLPFPPRFGEHNGEIYGQFRNVLSGELINMGKRKIRVLLAKPGLDGHDRGAKVVAHAMREAGMEVIYTGLHQTVPSIVNQAIQEDADVIGLSIMSGAHIPICKKLMEMVKEQDIGDKLIVVGGVIPNKDIPTLKDIGVNGIFPGGVHFDEIVKFIGENATK
jgi:methylmalonyl-CoA mutase cobalamin-binding domain/chain